MALGIAPQEATPFQRFMGLALCCPYCEYYEQEVDNLGRDFPRKIRALNP